MRNARGTKYPDPLQAALLAEQAGADAITLHLREDRRHIKDADLEAIRPRLTTRMNLESAITEEMLDIACRIKPEDVCLVPERRNEVTTEGGLDVIRYFDEVRKACTRLAAQGIRVSLFIDADAEQIKASAAASAACAPSTTVPATLAPSIDKSSLKITPSKPKSLRSNDSHLREKPAGCLSNFG